MTADQFWKLHALVQLGLCTWLVWSLYVGFRRRQARDLELTRAHALDLAAARQESFDDGWSARVTFERELTSSPRCSADRASKGIPSSRQEFPASTLVAPDSEESDV